MYRRLAVLILVIIALSAIPAKCETLSRRCLFVSVIQDPPVLSSRKDIIGLIGYAKRSGINNLFVQVYFANKAWFPSKIADPEPYLKCSKLVAEDPLSLLISESHKAGIRVHAWMNMLSLGGNTEAPLLKKYGPEVLTRNIKEKKSLDDYKIDNMFFLEPGDLRVREELLNIEGEVIRAYPDMDGVLFDYIRYPDKDPAYGFTEKNMERFRAATGVNDIDGESMIWKDWKRDQVTELLKALVANAGKLHPGITVSSTGCMPYTRAMYEAFQDWPMWIKSGLLDHVTVMSYSPEPEEFKRTIDRARNEVPDFTKVNIAIGAYKLTRLPDEFIKEFRIAEESGAGGFAIFHYGSLIENPALGDYIVKMSRKRRAQ